MTCQDKTRYPGRKRAQREARKIGDRIGEEMRAYLCEQCQGWHLTSSPRRDTAADVPRHRKYKKRAERKARKARTRKELELIAKRIRSRSDEPEKEAE